jgi:hypothetical protein
VTFFFLAFYGLSGLTLLLDLLKQAIQRGSNSDQNMPLAEFLQC